MLTKFPMYYTLLHIALGGFRPNKQLDIKQINFKVMIQSLYVTYRSIGYFGITIESSLSEATKLAAESNCN